MNLKIFDGVKTRKTPTPSKKQYKTMETSINHYYICFLKYLKDLITANNISGDYFE